MLKVFLDRLPKGLLSLITFLAILWLTLAPKPLGDEPPSLFPGADKVVHGIMFGGFASMLMLDWQRKHHWCKVNWIRVILSASVSSILGILIEIAQAHMGLGRGFEYADIIADTIGAFTFALIFLYLQNFWLSSHKK